ncbi:unnamed protein product [Adineta steineri]|uniref:FAD-binding PCMH-type domain-containing protein n=1 Tax=Adineta steineri TaxID=433720 RepID=A0A814UQ09_9BILA|nr:unnamed protein product [Adineta steineri]CAF1177772.1 unnamed protein product [Adineta steineri]
MFNASIDGRLVVPQPSAAVCNGKTYDAAACSVANAQWTNATWRSDQIGAMQITNWENSSCSIFFNSSTCNQGSVSVLGVDAISAAHVQTTVRFAATNNLRLAIKSSGHDFLGRSTAAGSLLLWLHHMKNMTMIDQYSSCGLANVSNAVRIEAGAQWSDVYQWLSQSNLVAIGPAAGTVTVVGGYLQGGGHSPLSRWKGLAADQVLEYDVVTADGQRQTVNACQNSDLFWALSGGGGGTFAIVLSAVIRTYPSPSIVVATYSVNATNVTRYATLMESFVGSIPQLADAGATSYFNIGDLTISVLVHIPNGDSNVLDGIINQFVANNSDLNFTVTKSFVLPSFYAYFAALLAPNNPSGYNLLVSSRFIPESIIRNNSQIVAAAFVQAQGQSTIGSNLRGSLVAGGQVSNTTNRNNSVNPGWRTALLSMAYTQTWLDTTSQINQNNLSTQGLLRGAMLDTILPAGVQPTCYTNEANPYEVNWQQKFYGSIVIYNQLKSIKVKYDPFGLFQCTTCVGSDDWTSDLNCPKTSNSNKINLTIFFLFAGIFAILL